MKRAPRSTKVAPLILMGPVQFLIFFIAIIPFILEIYLSLTPWSPRLGDIFQAPFNWGANYAKLITEDYRFLSALGRTALFTATAVTVEFFVGLGLAALVDREFKGNKAVFIILLVPMMFMPVVVGLNFYMIFQPEGPLNHFLSIITGSPIRIDWTTSEGTLFLAAILTDAWHWTPFMFLILLVGLQSVPPNIVNAAKTLGASNWSIFKDIKLPMMKRIILIALVIRAIESTKIFDELIMFAGGRTNYVFENISLWTYIINSQQTLVGYASSGALLIFILIILVTLTVVIPLLTRR
ncbi:MAG: sugar ABC transporter permease [Nitrososphaerales archaeon]